LGISAEFRSMHYNEIYTAWVVPRGFSQNYPNNERKKMPKKTYSVKAYYKDFFFYEVEAASPEEAKEIALANQGDWEKPDESWLELAGNAPIISSVKEV
jgi:hypothetical protein